jgi:predicted transposase/invertase (TIGR01784 family)
MIGRIDLDQHEATNNTDSGSPKVSSTKYWRDIAGIYSIVLTNKAFGDTRKKKTYADEPVMEPDLLNTYELRNVHHLERHFGEIPNQLTLLMLANLEDKPISARSHLERWASLFQEKALRHGARKIPETKAIEDPEELAAGDAAMKEFIESLDVRHLPQAVREQYIRNLRYYNDSWADIEEKATARGEARGEKAAKVEIARGMLKDKMSTTTIAKYTGLTADEIRAIK